MPRRKLLNIFSLLLIFVGLVVGIILIGKKTGLFAGAFGTPANLTIDTSTSFDTSNFVWKNLAQGGEEPTRMLQNVISKIKPLGISYIRIDQVSNLEKLDNDVSDILAMGAKPMVVLQPDSQMAEIIRRVSSRVSGVYYECANEPDLFGLP